MAAGTIHLQRIGAHAAMLQLDNPPANALGRAMRAEFLRHLSALEADLVLRVIVLTGRGETFCGGDDLKEQLAAQTAGGAARVALLGEFAAVLERIEACRVPVVAAIGGWAIGGGLELALACDIRIASDNARFVCAGVNVGLMASAWRLPRLIGVGAAKHMLLTGSPQDAETALRIGLISEICTHGSLLERATGLAERIASRAPLSVEATKRMASRAGDLPREEALRANAEEIEKLVRSADHAEALAAFRDKREPDFKRR